MTRVLLVDNDAGFRQSLARSLEAHGYDVSESETAAAAMADFRALAPDLVLLEVLLPHGDGALLCRDLRSESEVAIIILSALADEQTKVRALDFGADDYLTKPFIMEELLARMRAALRRSSDQGLSRGVFEAGPLTLHLEDGLLFLDGQEVHLTPTEFKLLLFFIQNAGRVLRHHTILSSVWGEEYVNDTQILRTYVNQLRLKLKDARAHPRFIRTVPGIGYRFIVSDS